VLKIDTNHRHKSAGNLSLWYDNRNVVAISHNMFASAPTSNLDINTVNFGSCHQIRHRYNSSHLICHIIDHNDAMCTAVVARRNGAESFLTSRVPLHYSHMLCYIILTTRGHALHIHVNYSSQDTSVLYNFFTERVIDVWNNLPSTVNFAI